MAMVKVLTVLVLLSFVLLGLQRHPVCKELARWQCGVAVLMLVLVLVSSNLARAARQSCIPLRTNHLVACCDVRVNVCEWGMCMCGLVVAWVCELVVCAFARV
jgi:hypothetical protein